MAALGIIVEITPRWRRSLRMARFKKMVLQVVDDKPLPVPEAIDFIVKDLDYSVVHLDLALRPLRKAPVEKNLVASLEMCLKIMATSAILLRTKYCREVWEEEESE
jgi:hypothetical protein